MEDYMFDLFRFVMLRPAMPADPHEVVPTASESDFQQQLERDRERPAPAAPMENTANQFLEGQHAVSKVSSLAFATAYDGLAASLFAAVPANRAALLTKIKNASGLDANDLVDELRFKEDRQRLADTLIAAKLGTARSDFPLDLIARNLRLIALIQRAADGDKRLDHADGIKAALNASIALPGKLLPLDIPLAAPWPDGAARPPGERERPGDEGRRKEQALREYHELTEAHDYLSGLAAHQVLDTGTSSLHIEQVGEGRGEPPAPPQREVSSDQVLREVRELRETVLKARLIAEGAVTSGLSLTSARIFQGTMLKIRPEALTEAPQTVHAGLRAAKVDPAATSISDAVDRINARRRELALLVIDDLIGVSCGAGGSNVSQIGSQFVPTCRVPDLKTREERNDHG
jgi:hypothetical protein